MEVQLTRKQFRRLLDMVYIGNWVLNSTRGDDRFEDYDQVESLLFAQARRDMNYVPIDESNQQELMERMDAYIDEFEAHGTENITNEH